MERYVGEHNLDTVYFFGFRNRLELPKFYAASDIFVLPSLRETWGMVVNEALCFGLPVIVSDQVGSAEDLVRHGYNGLIFPNGNVEALASSIKSLMELSEEDKILMGRRSKELIKGWSQRDLAESLATYLDSYYQRREIPGDKHPTRTV
ncbi:MAG: glycosyltransferase family 4 protein [Gemmatimonadetes bacterium]|nr:glycosyltransferase family 4 protein [Gemmatimonadota bacterium]